MAIDKTKVHSVGNINSRDILTIPEVFAGEDLENYSLVQLAYDGDKRKATYLNDAEQAYLLCAVEVMYDDETYKDFYVGKDEGCRVIQLEQGRRFETSNFEPITGVAPARGQFAEWDVTKKKFQLMTTPSDNTPAGKVFKVVNVSTGEYGFGILMVRLEVQ